MKICRILFLMSVFAYGSVSRAQTVYEETFDKAKSMETAGWVLRTKNPDDQWKISDGSLALHCSFKPYKGSSYARKVPFLRKGAFLFDVNLNSTGVRGYNHLSLQVRLYGLLTTFKGSWGDLWLRYHDKKWQSVARGVPQGKWVKCKIVFDADRKLVEYYLNDMETPCFSEEGVSLKPLADGKHGEIVIGNYGLAPGALIHRIDNLRLVKLEARKTAARIVNKAMVFDGIAASAYPVDDMLKQFHVARTERYIATTVSVAVVPGNKFALDHMPSATSREIPRYIIMADMPLGPKKFVPDFIQRRICEDVNNGACLLVLGGLFTLNKGEFQTSPLRKILPVKMGSPWAMTRFDTPRNITGKGVTGGRPTVKYLHALAVKSGAQLLATVEGAPFLVSWKRGKGKVVVCLGIPSGKFEKNATPFWRWKGYSKFLADALRRN